VNAIDQPIKEVSDMLARGEFDRVEQLTRGRRASAEDLRRVVAEYGRTLVPLPPEAFPDLDVHLVEGCDPPTCVVDVDLWTEEEGRSDLTLTLELVQGKGAGLRRRGSGLADAVGPRLSPARTWVGCRMRAASCGAG
jgi:hypothetical protein